jgi:integral membrane protein (TIGR01906 family)
MRTFYHGMGLVAAFCLTFVILISSVEAVVYLKPDHFEKEYRKYRVTKQVKMQMDDLLEVTDEMMAYLKGDREDLVIETVVNGEEREFFNEREKAHMVDVQRLFLIGLWTRRGAFAILVLCILGMIKSKAPITKMLPKAFLVGTTCFFTVVIAAGALFLSDFNKYFLMFHELCFTNNLWLLNPDTDLLIRMLPEGVFLEMVVRIGLILVLMLGITLIISIYMLVKQRNKRN